VISIQKTCSKSIGCVTVQKIAQRLGVITQKKWMAGNFSPLNAPEKTPAISMTT
jgi:hypothetical protein